MSNPALSVYPQVANNALLEPMFLGQPVNIARYDVQRHSTFEKLIEKQLSFFWRPEEVDLTKDRADFANLTAAEKHIFTSNLKYQILMDSIQGRSPNLAFLPIVSLPELETWIETWSFSESVHSRSYTHIIRNIYQHPEEVFDEIVDNKEIAKRAGSIAGYYDDLISLVNTLRYYTSLAKGDFNDHKEMLTKIRKALYLCLASVNILEAVRFYVSFACSFAFAERELMEGNAKIIRLVGRDEALHLVGTQHMLALCESGAEGEEMKAIAAELKPKMREMFRDAAQQEKDWAAYLFKDGSMVGLNKDILGQYVEYITNVRMQAVGLEAFDDFAKSNPIPWINTWLSSDTVQVAPQEVELSSYLIGQIDSSVDPDDLGDFEL